jgi:hypothetical protein
MRNASLSTLFSFREEQESAEGTVEVVNITNQVIYRFRLFGSVHHGRSLPLLTLPCRVRITLATLHPFTISRQSRTLVSSLSSCGFRYRWAGLYFDL